MTPEQREQVSVLTKCKRHPWSFGRSFLSNLRQNAWDRDLSELESAKLKEMWNKEGRKCKK